MTSQWLQRQFARRTGIRPIVCFFTICLALLFVASGEAQLYTGSITGVVQDPTGAVVPNASVTLVDTTKGLRYTATTEASGRYVLRSLPPSAYDIRVDPSGFRPKLRGAFALVRSRH